MQDVARLMFGIGGLITSVNDPERFLLLKRSANHSDFNQEKWELLFGRKNPLEEITDALHREAFEELGIDDLDIKYPVRTWHFFRGKRVPEKEIIGITFWCTTKNLAPCISAEHSEYRWVTASEALELVKVPGIRQDIEIYNSKSFSKNFYLSATTNTLHRFSG